MDDLDRPVHSRAAFFRVARAMALTLRPTDLNRSVSGHLGAVAVLGSQNWIRLPPRLKGSPPAMFENPLDPVWLVAGAALAAMFGLAGSVLAVYAVRRRRPVLGAVFGVLAIVVFGVLAVAAGFMAIGLLLLDSGMDELTPAEGARDGSA